jgi:hypothetical protein
MQISNLKRRGWRHKELPNLGQHVDWTQEDRIPEMIYTFRVLSWWLYLPEIWEMREDVGVDWETDNFWMSEQALK